MNKVEKYTCFLSIGYLLLFLMSCQKIEYTVIETPAYLRVFNSINHIQAMDTKGDTLPYMCMLINPEFDDEGMPIEAEIVGDFLGEREPYAPPYPSHIGVGLTEDNPEYPGKESVLAGPVLNGFDLSSWAQVPSGKMRFVFMYRPRNERPFFELDKRYKQDLLVDTVLNLKEGEVYTLHTLVKDFQSQEKGVLLREENFHKLALSDSLVYVNFYNYSARGYSQAERSLKLPLSSNMENLFQLGVRDTMNVYMSLFDGQGFSNYMDGIILDDVETVSTDFIEKYVTTVIRQDALGKPSPYISFPLWVSDKQDGIHTDIWQRFYFLAPGMQIENNRFDEHAGFYLNHLGGVMGNTDGTFAAINFLLNGPKVYDPDAPCLNCGTNSYHTYHAGVNFPNLIISTHSGEHNPRSFGSVNTIEIVNGGVYLTTVQRQYEPPAY